MKHITNFIKVQNEPHHCSTICGKSSNNYLVAAYVGRECTDNQRVFIKHSSGKVKYLENKTGNPLLWEQDSKIYLMYSRFEEDCSHRPVDRWKYCSNWVCEIKSTEDDFEIINVKEAPELYGKLARCAAKPFRGEVLLPLYREENPRPEIWTYDGDKFVLKGYMPNPEGEFGVAMQPTLGRTKDGLVALCRNYCYDEASAWVSYSEDGITWEPLSLAKAENRNSSLLIIDDYEDSLMLVYNVGKARKNLICTFLWDFQGKLDLTSPVGFNTKSYSYPNYNIIDNELHIVHTNNAIIAHHVMDIEFVDQFYRYTDRSL